ncbi:choice-of-anchor V domain-containing protein [Bacteroidota bacterium]
MRKFYSLIIPLCAAAVVVLMAGFGGGNNTDYPVGAPPGYTNSPFDGKNCSHCMGGTAVPLGGMITTDIPATGYVKGTTYNILVTATGNGNKGFELSPQNSSGNLLGTLIDGLESKLVGDGKYITHKLASEDNSMAWLFQWQAPPVGVGPITFYASVVIGKENTKTTTYIAPQSTLGVEDQITTSVKAYPNPIVDKLTISLPTTTAESVTIDLLSLNGNNSTNLFQGISPSGEQAMTFPIHQPAGVYLLRIQRGDELHVKKVVVQ